MKKSKVKKLTRIKFTKIHPSARRSDNQDVNPIQSNLSVQDLQLI